MNQTALTLCCAAIVGVTGLKRWPFPDSNMLVQMILFHKPVIFHMLRWGWFLMLFTTPALAFSGLFSLVFIFTGGADARRRYGKLPPFPIPEPPAPLHVVIGELHHSRKVERAESPQWLTIPDRGLFTGLAVFGAVGSGKTSACLRPFARQILNYGARDHRRKIGGIVLEVKGSFCHQVQEMLEDAGRKDDYIEIGMSSPYVYNPMNNDLEAFALAYSIATLLTQLYGRGKEPFWQQAYTNLVKFIILLHKVVDGYVTLFQIYECAINPGKLLAKIQEGEAAFSGITEVAPAWILIDPMVYLAHDDLAEMKWESIGNKFRTSYTDSLAQKLENYRQPYDVEEAPDASSANLARRVAQFAAVKRWFSDDWSRIDTKLRTSIVEGISVFLSLFDENPEMKRIFCPPRECYDPVANHDGRFGVPMPVFRDLIEAGKVVALNFPVAANPATARAIGCMLKQDFQRAMLERIPRIAAHPEIHWREAMFLCDEYQAFATVGESDPSGDEKFFALSREAKCIPMVATQSISSLRSTLPGESWRTLLQTFRTKLFLSLADDYSAKIASDLCGKENQLSPNYSIAESGNDVRISTLSGKAMAHKSGLSINKNYSMQIRPVFEPIVFTQLKNFQAIALAYDGADPLPPTLVYLKPWFLDRNLGYFEQVKRGKLCPST